jgi:antitoxin component of MazEF toxin-antitoxin module
MPIIRKLMKVGVDSKAVVLPKSWIDEIEQRTGQKVTLLTLEVNGSIKIEPLIKTETIPV